MTLEKALWTINKHEMEVSFLRESEAEERGYSIIVFGEEDEETFDSCRDLIDFAEGLEND